MIKLIKSTFYKEEEVKRKLNKFIKKAKQLSFGKECEKFERNFAKWQGRKYCIFLNSGSSANLAVTQSLLNTGRIKRGDCIGFSSLTWSTNVMPLIELGLKAVPIDVELNTLNVSSKRVHEVLKKYKMKMIFLTNLLGFCHDIDEVKKICDENNIILAEDNCEALGTIYKGKKLGNFGLASTFSFYVGHHMSTVEGGAVCTDDKELAMMLKLVRAHGWDRNLDFSQQNEIRNKFKVNSIFYSRYTFYDLGYNLRPTEFSGFIGNVQIEFLDEVIKKRNENFMEIAVPIYKMSKRYFPMRFDHMDFFSNFAIPLICKTKKIRDDLVKAVSRKIEIRPIVGGDMVVQPFFNKYMKKYCLLSPNAKLVHEQGLYFGNDPQFSKKEKKDIIKIFTS